VDEDLGLSMPDRHTLCNLMVEAEAVSAVFVPYEVTYQWFDDHGIGLTGQPSSVSRNDSLYDAVQNSVFRSFYFVSYNNE